MFSSSKVWLQTRIPELLPTSRQGFPYVLDTGMELK